MESNTSVIPQLVESFKQKNSAFLNSSLAGGECSNKLHTNNNQKDMTVDDQTWSSLFTDAFCHVCGADLQFESQRVSHYEGKKHAQKVRLYFQLYRELNDDAQVSTKPEQINFQDDRSGKVDKNKFCSLCNMVFSSAVVAQSHYAGKIHAKNIRKMGELVQKTPENFSLLNVLAEFTSSDTANAGSADVILSAANEEDDSLIVKSVSVTQHPKNDIISQEADNEAPLSSNTNTQDLDDPNKYCKLCSAPFTHPLMAQQHYTGKKHKRNEARKKMLEELGEDAFLSDSNSTIGVGSYICPVCSVTLTSIEMYQSHMQGNKHHLKESIVVNLMKNSKKKYDSFQDELADYIKVQKARGLEPKVSFRTAEDHGGYNSDEEDEISSTFGEVRQNSRSTQMEHLCTHSEGPMLYTAIKNQVYRGSLHNDHVELEYKQNHHLTVDCSQDKTIPLPNSSLGDGQDSSETDSSEHQGHVTSDNSSGSCKRESSLSRRNRKEKWRKDLYLKGDAEDSKRKKKRCSDSDSEKEEKHRHKRLKRCKQATESSDEDRVKHKRQGKNKHKVPADKVRTTKHTKHRREKKKKEENKRTEEEILWDESILGVC